MAPKHSKLGDIYRERQAQLRDAPSDKDTADDFVMIHSNPDPGRDTVPTKKPMANDDGAADMEVEEPFAADFGDEKMEPANAEDEIEGLESFGLTRLEMLEQAKKTGKQIELDTSKNLCWNCCEEFVKSELLPLTPTRLPTSARWQAYCFGCVQCEKDEQTWDWMNLETKDTAGFDWKKAQRDKEHGTRSVTDERGAPHIQDKNDKQIVMYHAPDGKSWTPDERFLPAMPQSSSGLIKGGNDTKNNNEMVPIHWKVVDAETGAEVVP